MTFGSGDFSICGFAGFESVCKEGNGWDIGVTNEVLNFFFFFNMLEDDVCCFLVESSNPVFGFLLLETSEHKSV